MNWQQEKGWALGLTDNYRRQNSISVLDWIDEKEMIMPDKVAVRDISGYCTYRELAHKARVIASSIGIAPRNAVLVYMEKSIKCFASMIASVYAGCFYSVIDPALPDERIRTISRITNARIIITDDDHESKATELFGGINTCIINIDQLEDKIDHNRLGLRRKCICDTDPMYCNFTSGSTGTAKGVLISHRSVMDFIPVFCDTMGLSSGDVFANQAPFDFDVSVKDLYSSVYLGAEVAIIPREYFVNPVALIDYLIESRTTTLVWAVSAMVFVSGMRAFRYRIPSDIRTIIFSGEVMPKKHIRSWKDSLPETKFVNVYGPTEITCNCTYHILDDEDFESGDIPIGIPFRNERVFLLDNDNNEITEGGVVGEICVAGTCLAIGYIGMDNNESFVQNPLNDLYKETIYRTGDRGRYDERNRLHFEGRLDNQVKHMGHRIELLEIEKQCDCILGVNRSGCVYDKDGRRIILFYDGEADDTLISDELKKVLPHYMVPSVIKHIDRMPVSDHGKLDRAALRKWVEGCENG